MNYQGTISLFIVLRVLQSNLEEMQALIHNRFKTAMACSGIPGSGVILRAILGPGGPVQTGSA